MGLATIACLFLYELGDNWLVATKREKLQRKLNSCNQIKESCNEIRIVATNQNLIENHFHLTVDLGIQHDILIFVSN